MAAPELSVDMAAYCALGSGELSRKTVENTKGRRRSAARNRVRWYSRLGLADSGRLETLRTAGHLELHVFALGKGLEALTLDRREVHEHVLSAFLRDESESLRLVEPLHCATSHVATPSVLGAAPPSNAV